MSLLLLEVEDEEERMFAQVCAMEERRSEWVSIDGENGGDGKGDVRIFPAPPRP